MDIKEFIEKVKSYEELSYNDLFFSDALPKDAKEDDKFYVCDFDLIRDLINNKMQNGLTFKITPKIFNRTGKMKYNNHNIVPFYILTHDTNGDVIWICAKHSIRSIINKDEFSKYYRPSNDNTSYGEIVSLEEEGRSMKRCMNCFSFFDITLMNDDVCKRCPEITYTVKCKNKK